MIRVLLGILVAAVFVAALANGGDFPSSDPTRFSGPLPGGMSHEEASGGATGLAGILALVLLGPVFLSLLSGGKRGADDGGFGEEHGRGPGVAIAIAIVIVIGLWVAAATAGAGGGL